MRVFIAISQIIASFAFLLFTGCSSTDGQDRQSPPPINVSIQEVRLAGFDQQIAYSGTIEEALFVPLSFAVVGTVSDVRVHEGETVHKGQLLASLNSEIWANSFDMANATLTRAEDAYHRMEPMHESGSLSPVKWVEIETGLQQARAAAAAAKKNLNDCKLYATVDGMVGRRNIDPGTGAASVMSAITLVRIDTVYARISVSEGEIAALKKDMTARILVPALNQACYTGIVEQIGVMSDPLMHTYKVKIRIPNRDHALLPGMLCKVVIADPGSRAGVVVPTGAVMSDAVGKRYLFVADTMKHVALRREVVPGSFIQSGMEIAAGLEPGEWVVVSGQQKLVDQSPINYIR